MGYSTYYSGEVAVVPPLNEHEISYLEDFNKSRRMHRTGGPLFVKGGDGWGNTPTPDTIHDNNNPDPDQPGLWCQWVPSEDGTEIAWDEGEKFYNDVEWMVYLIECLLSPAARAYVNQHIDEDERLKHFTCDHVLDGEIYADGEDTHDNTKIKVTANKVEQLDGVLTYGDEVPDEPPAPTPEEVRAALKSLGAKVNIEVWTLTIDGPNSATITTCIFATEEEAYEHLNEAYVEEGVTFNTTTEEGRGEVLEHLLDSGYALYIDQHTLEVPA